MRQVRRIAFVAAIAAVALGGIAAPAVAAPPPAGYPTGQVMISAANTSMGKTISIRRGFYDAAVDKGFGLDKIWNKHNIHTTQGMGWAFKSPVWRKSGTQYELDAWAQKVQCWTVSGKKHCKVVDEVQLRGVFESANQQYYYGWPAGNPVGALTLYCLGYNPKCPDWVTVSMQNAAVGKTAAMQRSTGSDSRSIAPTPGGQTLSPYSRNGEPVSPGIASALEEQSSGNVMFFGSYAKMTQANVDALTK